MTETPKHTHLATLYGEIQNVPVRKEDGYWWSKWQVNYGIVHAPRNVSDLRPIES